MNQTEGEENICLEMKVFRCPPTCGGHYFEISLSNGVDGKTPSLWLKCSICKKNFVFRRGIEQLMVGMETT